MSHPLDGPTAIEDGRVDPGDVLALRSDRGTTAPVAATGERPGPRTPPVAPGAASPRPAAPRRGDLPPLAGPFGPRPARPASG